jgi:glutathione S-transferase
MAFWCEAREWKVYAGCAGVLGVKMFAMAVATAFMRLKARAVANPEDEEEQLVPGGVCKVDSAVERVRRAHLNDLENIPLFLALAPVFLATQPGEKFATRVFLVFTAARIAHTCFYLLGKAKGRFVSFMVAMGAVNVMLGRILYSSYKALAK